MELRPAQPSDAPAIARVHVETWKTAYRCILSDEFLDTLSYERRARFWRQLLDPSNPRPLPSRHFVYVVGHPTEQVIGFASGGSERDRHPVYRGELGGIYILEHYQHHGLGKKLVGAIARRLLTYDIQTMLVWVLADNRPARQFYQALGGLLVGDRMIQIGSASLSEVAYGWVNLNTLVLS
ncbi:MAG: N-acetyltransferase family protein [Elainellaceae cyanobacterium]